MKHLTPQQIALFIGHQCEADGHHVSKILSVHENGNIQLARAMGSQDYWESRRIKLILRSIDQMTDGEFEHLARLAIGKTITAPKIKKQGVPSEDFHPDTHHRSHIIEFETYINHPAVNRNFPSHRIVFDLDEFEMDVYNYQNEGKNMADGIVQNIVSLVDDARKMGIDTNNWIKEGLAIRKA